MFAGVGVPLWLAMIAVTVAGRQLPLVPWAAFQFVQALAFGAIVAKAAGGVTGVVGKVLESRIMVALGRISYGIYLAHMFAPAIVRAALFRLGVDPLSLRAWAIQPLFAMTTIALAAVSWLLIEGPINRQKDRFPYHREKPAPPTDRRLLITSSGRTRPSGAPTCGPA
jgi:peptidoglycan/LPS O-acetylase OafA/YrhL